MICVGVYVLEGKVTPNAKSYFRVQGGSQFRMDFMLDDADGTDTKQLRKAALALHGDFGNQRNSNVWGRYELSLDESLFGLHDENCFSRTHRPVTGIAGCWSLPTGCFRAIRMSMSFGDFPV